MKDLAEEIKKKQIEIEKMNKKELDEKLVDIVYKDGQKGDDELEDHKSSENESDEESKDPKEEQDPEKNREQSESESHKQDLEDN